MNAITRTTSMAFAAVLAAGLIAACSSYRTDTRDLERGHPSISLQEHATVTIERFEQRDPSLRHFLDNSHGYLVIPEVTKAGVGVGGAHGEGVVWEAGEIIGHATMTQATLGAQLGGQVYSQIIFFEDAVTLDRFKQGNLELSARASAIAATSGAAADADFDNGVAIFTLPRTGLMFEAAVGGQKFSFVPWNQ